jgi:tetratricopeptide (TPR) repeat protein
MRRVMACANCSRSTARASPAGTRLSSAAVITAEFNCCISHLRSPTAFRIDDERNELLQTSSAAPEQEPSAEAAAAEQEAQDTAAQDTAAQAAANTGATPAPADPAAEPAETADDRAAPARSNRPDAVMGQRASRTDRVAKANELKAEGRAHYQAGRFREAARSYELATRQTPSDGGAFAGLGASLLSSNDADGAIRAYQRAVQIDGQSSGFHAALGRAYALKGDRARARASYTRALELNPKNGAAQQGLDRLKK